MKVREKMFLWASIFTFIVFTASIVLAADIFELKGGTAANIEHPRAKAGQNFIKILEAKTGGKRKGIAHPFSQNEKNPIPDHEGTRGLSRDDTDLPAQARLVGS